VLDAPAVLAARHAVHGVHIAPTVEAYIVALVRATREPGTWRADWAQAIDVGASPRASLALAHTAAAWAWMQGRDYVSPDDVRELAPDVLRHRIAPSLQSRLGGLGRDALIQGLIDAVPAP
jgi:MoxR-like ATPase